MLQEAIIKILLTNYYLKLIYVSGKAKIAIIIELNYHLNLQLMY